jgi:hypothetical protein
MSRYTDPTITADFLVMTLILLFAPLSKRKLVNLRIYLKLKGFFFRTECKKFVLDDKVDKNALKIYAYEDLSLWNVVTCRLVNCYGLFERFKPLNLQLQYQETELFLTVCL